MKVTEEYFLCLYRICWVYYSTKNNAWYRKAVAVYLNYGFKSVDDLKFEKKFSIIFWGQKYYVIPVSKGAYCATRICFKSQTRWYCWNLHLLESCVIFLSPLNHDCTTALLAFHNKM